MGPLQQETFDVWRDGDDQFKQQILEHMRAQTLHNLASEKRLATVEEKLAAQERRGTWISVFVSTIVSGVVGGLAGRQ